MADIFIDFTASNNGDGTAPGPAASGGAAGAFNDWASLAPVAGDCIWIRRDETTQPNIAPSGNYIFQGEVKYIGWPKAGDTYYDARPTAAAALWDGDAADFVYLTGSSNRAFNPASTTGQNGGYISRIHRIMGGAHTTYGWVVGGGVNWVFEHIGLDGNEAAGLTNKFMQLSSVSRGHRFIGTTTYYGSIDSTGSDFLMDMSGNNCYFEHLKVVCGEIQDLQDGYGIRVAGDGNVIEKLDYSTNLNRDGVTVLNFNVIQEFVLSVTGEGNIVNMTYKTGIDEATTSDAGDFLVSGNNNTINAEFLDNACVQYLQVSGVYNKVRIKNFRTAAHSTQPISVSGNEQSVVLENYGTVRTPTQPSMSGNGGVLIIENGSFTPALGTPSTSVGRGAVIQPNYQGVAGSWRADMTDGYMQSSNTVRSGGSGFSLFIERDQPATDGMFPVLGYEVANTELMWVDLVDGVNTITMFGAYKNYTQTLNKAHLWLDTTYKDTDGFERKEACIGPGVLTADTSVWSGDTSLTVFKLVLTVDLSGKGAQTVPLRLKGNIPYEAGAYVYIDPTPVVS